MEFFVMMYEHDIKRDTDAKKFFFKKYRCFDGMGSCYFDTQKEAMRYVANRSRVIQNAMNFSLSQFSVISKLYIDNLVRYKKYCPKASLVNEYLRDSLIVINYLMSSGCKMEYVLSKIIYLLRRYKIVIEILGYNVLLRTVCDYLETLEVEYPVFESVKYKKNKNYEMDFKKAI